MKTDELITILSQAPQPKKPVTIVTALLLLLAVAFSTTILVLGIRTDLTMPLAGIGALYKTILLCSILWLAGSALKDAAQPISQHHSKKLYIALLAVYFLASLIGEWLFRNPEQLHKLLMLHNFELCLGAVTLYGATAAIVLTLLIKKYAAADIQKSATLIGLTAASVGGLGYSIHCPIDSPTFILLGYGLPILLITLCARVFAKKFIKW